MKRVLLLLCTLCVFCLSAMAQRIAVLEFKAGVGITQNDVDGISAIFLTHFRPNGYSIIERSQINKILEEQGLQRSSITEDQVAKIGKLLNVQYIVVGDVNLVMGQYNVDVRLIDVEKGIITATEGDAFSGTSYRSSMQNIAQKLAEKISSKPVLSGSSSSKIGVVNYTECVQLCPEADRARKLIDESTKRVSNKYQSMADSFNAKYEEYQTYSATWTSSVRQAKEKELTDLQQSIQEYQTKSEAELQQQQNSLMAPIYSHVSDVISRLAKEKQLPVVYDISTLLFINYQNSNIVDLTQEARRILNIPFGRTVDDLQKEIAAKAN